MKNPHKILFICFLALLNVSSALAQVYSTANQAVRSANQTYRVNTQQIATPSYTPYQSTVYEPFTTIVPSQRAGAGRPDDGAIGDTKPTDTNDDIIGGDFGNVSDPGEAWSPVGEPWVLLIFAAMAAVVIYRKRAITLKKNI